MNKYLLLLREDLEKMQQLSEEEIQQCTAVMTKWCEDLAAEGFFVAGEPLDIETRYVKPGHIGTDGPFAEARESISGYILVHARDLEHAAAIAAQCPHVSVYNGAVEVRPLMAH
ncbi:YciI family protein [Chitinophaga alhagiae]|uniref:YciI family protein n=1 Tax=Chitinophaga alhagiae TaxID=2203219 RepID=UPI001300B932|nr:YciI family protein [Chitinophaga alhagiae]